MIMSTLYYTLYTYMSLPFTFTLVSLSLIQAAVKLEANLTLDTVTAEELTEKLVIVSSDFKRAIETAEIMQSHFKPNTPIKTDVALRERDFGEFNRAPWREALPIILENDRVNPTKRVHGCEPVPEMVVRVMRVLKTIEEEYTDKIVVIISHSNPLHVLWAMCNRVSSTERFKDLKHFKNCEVREFKFV